MPDKVVDASVLGSLLFEEPRAQEADDLITDSALQAPQLLLYELTHIAQKKSLQYPDQREAFQRSLEAALTMDISWREVDHIRVLELALETGLSAYDASYLYVARSLGLPLVTFDHKLQAAFTGPRQTERGRI